MRRLCAIALFLVAALFPFLSYSNLDDGQWVFHHDGKEQRFTRAGERRGSPYVYVDELTKRFKLQKTIALKDILFRISDPRTARWVQISTQSPVVESSWNSVSLSRAAEVINGRLAVPIEFGDRALRPLLENRPPSGPSLPASLFAADVVIDPGHGGNDFGAYRKLDSGKTIREKDINLALSQKLAQALRAEGLQVALTREDDNFLTLPERSFFANRLEAKLFISMHINAAARESAKGFEIYLLSLDQDDNDARAAIAKENQAIPDDLPEGIDRMLSDMRASANFERSLEWAKVFERLYRASGRESFGRPIKMGPFYVLYGASMPALLIEHGFISHAEDREWLIDSAEQKSFFKGLAKNISKKLKGNN